MVNFGPLMADIVGGFGAPQQISTGFASWLCYCTATLFTRPTKLCTTFDRFLASTLYIRFRGLLPPDGILPDANFTLPPSLAFSYIGSITARRSTSERRPNFAAWYTEWNYGTFADGATYIRLGGHYVGHRPTFYVGNVCGMDYINPMTLMARVLVCSMLHFMGTILLQSLKIQVG